MCGIVGIVGTQPTESLRLEMRDTLVHRGPDAVGSYQAPDGSVWVGHTRLAILDLSPGGHQPMSSACGGVTLVFNGEIYNHASLREQLSKCGHTFRSTSDTEVFLAAYLEWGDACFRRLNGMFAAAIIDLTRRRVLLVRDPAGEKPLYYLQRNGTFLFASELKAILKHPDAPSRISLDGLNHYLAYGYVPAPLTMVEQIRKVRPAEVLCYSLDTRELATWTYWEPPRHSPVTPQPIEGLTTHLLSLLEASVKLRLVADVPVGVLLSGGLDSSLIAVAATRVAPEHISTFSVAFPGHRRLDETAYAQAVATYLGTKHHQIPASSVHPSVLIALARQFDDPIADYSLVPTYLLSKAISNHVTVALSGDGADELFGGYPHYSYTSARAALPRPARPIMHFLAAAARRMPVGFIGRNALCNLSNPSSLSYANLYFDAASRIAISPPLRDLAPANLLAPEYARAGFSTGATSLVEAAMRLDFSTYLPDNLLVKIDRASMLASLEVRAPWLDPHILQFAMSTLPTDYKTDGQGRKLILQALAHSLLPSNLDWSRKQGFTPPLQTWLSTTWKPLVDDALLQSASPLLATTHVRTLLSHTGRLYSNTHRIFALLMLVIWAAEYDLSP